MSENKPTEPGWYWAVRNDIEDVEAVYFDGETIRTIIGTYHPKCFKYFYYPKLEPPQ